MEKHICKLCPKSFSNGRSLGGHMRSHLPSPVLPNPKTEQLGSHTESDSSSTRSDPPNLGSYGLRENPKKSSKGSEHALFLDSESIVQDRESETESTRNPTRGKRSKKQVAGFRSRWDNGSYSKGVIESKRLKLEERVKCESPTESTQVSSVSDPSQDEEVALWLMMLSRDKSFDSVELTRSVGFKCLGCDKKFKTKNILVGHKCSNNKITTSKVRPALTGFEDEKIYECPFCYKVFGSGQALGGHKRSHLLKSSRKITSGDNIIIASNIDEMNNSFNLDLNLPAPVDDEDEEYS